MRDGPNPPRWTGRRVLIALLLFFGVVAAVNAAMIWIALQSWPGLSARDAARDNAMRTVAAVVRPPGGRDVPWTG